MKNTIRTSKTIHIQNQEKKKSDHQTTDRIFDIIVYPCKLKIHPNHSDTRITETLSDITFLAQYKDFSMIFFR